VDDTGARLDVDHVATETITLTRTFGMVPASRVDIVEPALFGQVIVAANIFVKAGTSINPAFLEGTTLVVVKRFYDAAREVPGIDLALKSTRLRERAWRCASHVAFYALQEYQRRCKIIPAVARILQGMSLVQVREHMFPSKELLADARDALKDADMPAGCLSTVYMSGMARHARHLLETTMRKTCRGEIARALADIVNASGSIMNAITTELQDSLADLPASIARATSVRLTHRVKDRARSRGMPTGKHRLDTMIDAILDGMDISGWQQARRLWREGATLELVSRVNVMDAGAVARNAVKAVLTSMTVDEAIAAMFSVRQLLRVGIHGTTMPDPTRVVRDQAMVSARNRVGVALWDLLAPVVHVLLTSMAEEPGRYVSLPQCKKHAIPLAIDDGQVYRLDIKVDGDTGRVTAAAVRFSLEPGVIRAFSLRGLYRIDAMHARGFVPARGTITRKPGGGLLLHLPFEKEITVDPFPGKYGDISMAKPDDIVVAGVDLGLKHLAWQSIGKCHQATSGNGSWEPVDKDHPEIARYCIDQPQLVGRKDAWLARVPALSFSNVKRKLIVLMSRARALQRQKDLLRQRYRGRYKHAWRYFVARREWQRCWRKVRHLQEEIARQVATRIVAACKHQGVELLRFEDLSWSSHSAKRVSGAWLATWQVHWFFSQIQERATRLARLAGIAVELVDARGTSKRCSACGTIGSRNGKTFSCTNKDCGKRVDSDLNGSRNVRFAPTSPRPYTKGEGARYRPLACHVSTSPNLSKPGKMSKFVQV
jgi:transposase